jgi:hypothetical protein
MMLAHSCDKPYLSRCKTLLHYVLRVKDLDSLLPDKFKQMVHRYSVSDNLRYRKLTYCGIDQNRVQFLATNLQLLCDWHYSPIS